jgi:hypothetical protein
MHNEPTIVRTDLYTRFCLTAIAVLLTALVLTLWCELPSGSPAATAAEPPFDAAAQRADMVKAADRTNAKLDELIALLRSGEAKVQVLNAEAKKEAPRDNTATSAEKPKKP